MQKEIWKQVVNKPFTSYQISSFGRVKNKYEKILKTNIDKDGYERITLNYKGFYQTIKIHILVAYAFIKKPKDFYKIKYTVNHIDGVKTNNTINNLEWLTYSDNLKHAFKIGIKSAKGIKNSANKYAEKDIISICKILKSGDYINHRDIVNKVFLKDLSDIETKRLIKLVSQIKCKDRWSCVSDNYF